MPRTRRTKAQIAADNEQPDGLIPVTSRVLDNMHAIREHFTQITKIMNDPNLTLQEQAQLAQYGTFHGSRGSKVGAQVAYRDPATSEPVLEVPFANRVADTRMRTHYDLKHKGVLGPEAIARLCGISRTAEYKVLTAAEAHMTAEQAHMVADRAAFNQRLTA